MYVRKYKVNSQSEREEIYDFKIFEKKVKGIEKNNLGIDNKFNVLDFLVKDFKIG